MNITLCYINHRLPGGGVLWNKVITRPKLVQIEESNMITLRITPDRTVDNRQNYKLIKALHEFYATPLKRISLGKWFIRYRPKDRIWYDITMTKEDIKFYMTVPERWEKYARQKIEVCWPRASVEVVDPNELSIPTNDTLVAEMAYKRHNIFALHVDRTEDTQPLMAVMRASSDLEEGDISRLSICADPIHRLNWQDQANQAHKQFTNGKTPQRRGFTKKRALVSAGTTVEGIFEQLSDVLLAVLGHGDDKKIKEDDLEKRQIMVEGKLGNATISKKTEPTFKTYIRIASHSEDGARREMNARALANAFVEVAGDNELEKVDVGRKATVRILYELNTHTLKRGTMLDFDSTIMGASELGKLMQLPGPGLQDEFSEKLETIKTRQENVPATVSHKGLPLGCVELKHQAIDVYMPTTNKDEFCLPSVSIMGMGMGKSTLLANMAVGAVRLKLGAISIDPAKRLVGKDIMAALSPEDFLHVDLSRVRMALDFRESFHAEHMTTRLANTILAFFDMEGEELQTERFLFAAVMAMKTRRLSEILQIFENDVYRQSLIKEMPEGINKTTLAEFGKYKPDRQRQILAPIMNRLSIIFRDDYLAECMDAEEGLDFWELLQTPKAIIIDVPDDTFDPLVKDLLINLINVKIDIAMRLRPEEKQFPYLVLLDEPHQYLKSAGLWNRNAVESRKFGIKYCWFFHNWDQLPRDLIETIKSAGPHFHIGRSTEQTFKHLAPYLAPYTVDDVTKMPSFHCINVLRAGHETVRPFMAKMLPPPGQFKKKEVETA